MKVYPSARWMRWQTRARQSVALDAHPFLLTSLGILLWFVCYMSLEPLMNWLTSDVLQLAQTSALGSALAFFLFEVPKVLLLLVLVVFGVGIIRSFFTPERTRRLLAGKLTFSHIFLVAAWEAGAAPK